jgi:hypothetical protein
MKTLIKLLLMIGSMHTGLAQQGIYEVTPGDGNGLRFWQSDLFKVHMGTGTEYQFGPVTDYSIKMNMSNRKK